VALKSPGVETLYAVFIRLPIYAAGVTWCLHFSRAGGGTGKFFKRARLPEARMRSFGRAGGERCAQVLLVFVHFMIETVQIKFCLYTVRQTSRVIYAATFF